MDVIAGDIKTGVITFLSDWLKTSEGGAHGFKHGLDGLPTHVVVQGRESAEGPVFQLENMVLQISEDSILLEKKIALHCREVRVCAHIDHRYPPFEGDGPYGDDRTPWLKEVDEL